jgi:ABC-type branched-subunit amino acid transport system substrate-binding protein
VDSMVRETYNLGDMDFRTQLSRFKSEKLPAVMSVGFEGEIASVLRNKTGLQYQFRLGTVDDSLTEKTRRAFPEEVKGTWTFGFKAADPMLRQKFGDNLGSEFAATLAYIHVKQLARAIVACNEQPSCAVEKLKASPAEPELGFRGFNQNRIANLEMEVKQY